MGRKGMLSTWAMSKPKENQWPLERPILSLGRKGRHIR
jgi:hypothetical protein